MRNAADMEGTADDTYVVFACHVARSDWSDLSRSVFCCVTAGLRRVLRMTSCKRAPLLLQCPTRRAPLCVSCIIARKNTKPVGTTARYFVYQRADPPLHNNTGFVLRCI
jgi:hypothetical protein